MEISNKTIFLLILISFSAHAEKSGEICHVEADYYWAGVWQPYGKDELICDYWTINSLVFDSDEAKDEEFELWEDFPEAPEYETDEYGDDESASVLEDTTPEADDTNDEE